MAEPEERTGRTEAGTPRRPNFVVILADDLGYSDIGCYGSEVATPNLEALAGSGLRFSQAYNCARCCPTRAALLTGLYPHQAGVGHMVGNYGIREYQGYLRDDCVTIAEALKTGGYRTMMAGKWHVGGGYQANRPETWRPGTPGHPLPVQRGFDTHYGMAGGGGSYFNPPYIVHQPVHVIDIFPTLLEAAGVPLPERHGERRVTSVEGESLLSLLAGAPWTRDRPIFFEHEGNRAVRDGQWKLVSRHPGSWELYDMLRDRTELHDLAAARGGEVRRLAGLYDDWAHRCGVVPWHELQQRRAP